MVDYLEIEQFWLDSFRVEKKNIYSRPTFDNFLLFSTKKKCLLGLFSEPATSFPGFLHFPPLPRSRGEGGGKGRDPGNQVAGPVDFFGF